MNIKKLESIICSEENIKMMLSAKGFDERVIKIIAESDAILIPWDDDDKHWELFEKGKDDFISGIYDSIADAIIEEIIGNEYEDVVTDDEIDDLVYEEIEKFNHWFETGENKVK